MKKTVLLCIVTVIALLLCGCNTTTEPPVDPQINDSSATDTTSNPQTSVIDDTTAPVTSSSDTEDETTSSSQTPTDTITIKDDIYTDKTEFESGAYAEIFVTAPKLEATAFGENADVFNQLIDLNVDTIKNEYLYDVAVGDGAEGAYTSSRMLSYDIYCAEDGKVSVLLKIVYQSGSSNPVTTYKGINFDLSQGRIISFTDVADEAMIPAIKNNILEQMRKDPTNFYSTDDGILDDIDITATFVFSSEALYVYFDEYVIAPRVAGLQIFEIDLDGLN